MGNVYAAAGPRFTGQGRNKERTVIGTGSSFRSLRARIAGLLLCGWLLAPSIARSDSVLWQPGTPPGKTFEVELKQQGNEWVPLAVVPIDSCSDACLYAMPEPLAPGTWIARVRACDEALCTVWVESRVTIKAGVPEGVLIIP